VIHSGKLDHAQALIEYEGGAVASLTASRVTESKIRAVQITGRKAFITVDCLNRSVEISRKTHYTLDLGHDISYRQESIVEKVFVPFKEPLLAEFEEFARSILEGDTPKTSGPSARRALELCDLISNGAGESVGAAGAAGAAGKSAGAMGAVSAAGGSAGAMGAAGTGTSSQADAL
jgi:predicted dehydrogenase